MDYELLRNRMENGTPFLRARALERITALADGLEITQAQAEELAALARSRGLDLLPQDGAERLRAAEERLGELELALAELTFGGEQV